MCCYFFAKKNKIKMWLKHTHLSILLLSLQCRSGNFQSLAEKECQRITKNYQSSMGNYIVNGREASLGELPYVVAIAIGLTVGNVYHCGGTLVSSNCVLTAAHCVDTLDSNTPIIARIGTINITDPKWNPKTDHKVVQKYINPQYNRNEKYNDLAVLKLDTPLNLSANTYPACLSTNNADMYVRHVIAGWGYTESNGTMADKLRVGTVTPIARSDCQQFYGKFKKALPNGITADLICAIDPQGKQDACQGDSGGPLLITAKDGKTRLVGVTASGLGCGTKYPGIYTRVSRFTDWTAQKCGFAN